MILLFETSSLFITFRLYASISRFSGQSSLYYLKLFPTCVGVRMGTLIHRMVGEGFISGELLGLQNLLVLGLTQHHPRLRYRIRRHGL